MYNKKITKAVFDNKKRIKINKTQRNCKEMIAFIQI